MEPMDAPKFEYFLRKYEDSKNQSIQPKIRHSKNAYNYCRFWRNLIITKVEEKWRSSKMWILARTCDKNEPPMDPNKDGAVRNCEFPGGHSNILESAESRKWTALQFYWRTQGRRREAKLSYTNQLIRFIARTPCCKQLFGEKPLRKTPPITSACFAFFDQISPAPVLLLEPILRMLRLRVMCCGSAKSPETNHPLPSLTHPYNKYSWKFFSGPLAVARQLGGVQRSV